MKKMITLMLVVVMLVACMATTAFAAKANDVVPVEINVSGNPGFGCYTVVLSYDSSALELVSVTEGLSAGKGTFAPSVATKKVSFFVGDLNNVEGDGTLFTANFKVLSTATKGTTYTVDASFEPGSVADAANNDVTMNISGGSVSVDACQHQWGAWTETTPASCTAEGVETRTCGVCNVSETRAIPKADHAWGAWTETTPASCTAEGVETRTCGVCNETETRAIPKVDHAWGAWTETTPASCTAEGVETRTCGVCNEPETRAIPKLAHTPDATWSRDETNHWHVCQVCNNNVDVAAHQWNWVVDKKATATETGLQHQECACGAVTSKDTVIPKVEGLDDVPQTGDLTPVIVLVTLITVGGVSMLLMKRKAVR